MLRGADRRDDLRWLFEKRVERADDAHKVELLTEWAVLEEDAFQAPERSVALYRRVLEVAPDHGGALRLPRAAGGSDSGKRNVTKQKLASARPAAINIGAA